MNPLSAFTDEKDLFPADLVDMTPGELSGVVGATAAKKIRSALQLAYDAARSIRRNPPSDLVRAIVGAKDAARLEDVDISDLPTLTKYQLMRLGVSERGVVLLMSAFALALQAARAEPAKGKPMRNAEDIDAIMRDRIALLPHEELWVLFANKQNIVKDELLLSKGTQDGTQADPREVLREALLRRSAGIFLVHNHPSGNSRASTVDEELTRRISRVANDIMIPLTDHVIIARGGFTSLQATKPALFTERR